MRLLEAEDRDIEGKEIIEFLEFPKDLSSAIKGQDIKTPVGAKERRQIFQHILVIRLNSKDKEDSYVFQRRKDESPCVHSGGK